MSRILLSVSAIASLVGLSYAAPARPVKRTVSATDFNVLALYEQYAAASYCPANYNGSSAKLACSAGNCPQVQDANTKIILPIKTTALTDTAGYVAVDNTNQIIAVSFRGSESVRNYVTDLTFSWTDIDTCDGCRGFKGLWQAWSEVKAGVTAAVASAQAANPAHRILVTGHSLGGGIASIAAVELRNTGLVVDMTSFGAPRFGNEAFAEYAMAQAPQLGMNYRVAHQYDPVPTVPMLSSGFRHTSPAYFITTATGVNPTIADIEIQEGTSNQNPWGSSMTIDGQAHDFYFNEISSCFPHNGILFKD